VRDRRQAASPPVLTGPDDWTQVPGWIVVAKWSDSADTYYGLWECVEYAEAWAVMSLGSKRACRSWHLELLQPRAWSAGRRSD
jgi:hypothetical protein